MPTARDQMIEILKEQPEDSSYDELLRELAFNKMVDRGLKDAREGRTISNAEMGERIRSWRK